MALDDDIKLAHDEEIAKLKELEDKLTDEERMHNEALRNILDEKRRITELRTQLQSGRQRTTSSYF